METLFSPEYYPLWAILLAVILFFPVRRLIWMLSVNRAARKAPVTDDDKHRLRRRAGLTAALLCWVFALLYTYTLFHGFR